MHLTQRFLVASVLAVTAGAAVAAIEPFPNEDGWSGFGIFGLGYMDGKSNLISGNDLIDIGTDPVATVNDSPRSEDDAFPFLTGEIRYTWAEPGTQVFLGSTIEDIVTLDFAQQLIELTAEQEIVIQCLHRRDHGMPGLLSGGLLAGDSLQRRTDFVA